MGISTKIVGFSGSRGAETVEFMNSGIDAFYVKPITHAELIPILEDIIKTESESLCPDKMKDLPCK